jgi:hypothetical protein
MVGETKASLLLSRERLFGTVQYVACWRPTELITSNLITDDETKLLTSQPPNSICTSQLMQFVSVVKTSQLMLYREIMAVCSEIHTKQLNTAVLAECGIVEC